MTNCLNVFDYFVGLVLKGLKSVIENSTGVTLRLRSNMTANSNNEINHPSKLLLTDKQVSSLLKVLQIIYQSV